MSVTFNRKGVMRMKKGFFIVLFLLASVFAFAKSHEYNLKEDFQIGMEKSIFEDEMNRLGWKVVSRSDVSYILVKENEYFNGIKVNLISVAFTDDKLSVFAIVFLPDTKEQALFIDYYTKFSNSNYAKLSKTYEKHNCINYCFVDKKGYTLTFSIPNTNDSKYYAITCAGK